jgi:ubiquinone/menaquinone biosynthesis C-methylase UbiE
MATFHFVEDYQALVRDLMARHPLQEAMSLAVGGGWESMGLRCAKLLRQCGLESGMTVLDFGCGSGRVASALSKQIQLANYVGIDVVPELLHYAALVCPKEYQFVLNQSLELPVAEGSFDVIYAFSVFTHLLQTEIGLYTVGCMQKLKPSGRFIFSFLELDKHWSVFTDSMTQHLAQGRPFPHLNTFLSRDQITILAHQIGFEVERWIEPNDAEIGIGQSAVVLRKPG